MEAEKVPDLEGPAEGNRPAPGSSPYGAIAQLGSVPPITGVRQL